MYGAMSQTYEPISLGFACEVKYQLARVLYERKFPDGNENDFRNTLLSAEYGQRNFERHIFDWQITPFKTVLKYLETDFQGVFEREDLVVDGGQVIHRRLGTRHPHDFHAVDGVLDDRAIDAGYDSARGKLEHLARKFRLHLERLGPFLYVHREIRTQDETLQLMDLLRARNPRRAFKILYVGYAGEDQWLEDVKGEVFKAWAPLRVDKPDHRQWEGDNQSWDKILEAWDLTVHGGDRIVRHEDDNSVSRRSGLMHWLRRPAGGR
jgi:hypothetical protein